MTTRTDHRAGQGWAYAGAILGGLVSMAANVAHSYVPPARSPHDWSPRPGAVIGALFWPVALLIAAEILSRTAWPTGRRWVALRYLGLLPVALVAAVVSYRHLSGLLHFYGEDPLTATIGPLAVDGLMTMATAALMAAGRLHSAADTRDATATAPALAEPAAPPPAVAVPRDSAPVPPVRALRLPPAMREAIDARAAQVTAEGRALTADDVRAALRVPADMAAQIVRDLATADVAP